MMDVADRIGRLAIKHREMKPGRGENEQWSGDYEDTANRQSAVLFTGTLIWFTAWLQHQVAMCCPTWTRSQRRGNCTGYGAGLITS